MVVQDAKNSSLFTGKHRRRHNNTGFSLIELLVVVLIIGLGIRIVSVNVGGSQQRQVLQQARQFVNATSLIAEEAVLSRQQWGIDFYRQAGEQGDDQFGYRWLILKDERWRLPQEREDQPIDVLFSPTVQLRLEFDDVEQEIEFKQALSDPDEDKEEENEENSEPESKRSDSEEPSEQKPSIKPHVWLLSSGEMTAFTLTLLGVDDPDNTTVIKGDELGRVHIETGAVDDEDF